MSGIFAEYQPRYAEHGIATFPVKPGKKIPAVTNWNRMGLPASNQLRRRHGSAESLGFLCGARSKIAVLDVDDPSEKLLADALDEFGPTPFIVRSGSGHHQAWYRHNGESRKVRPDKARPVDILGGGFVVAPPSRGKRGTYEIVSGTLMDLASLPRMRRRVVPLTASNCNAPADAVAIEGGRVEQGQRNDQTFRHCLLLARSCASWEEMLCKAALANIERNSPPLPEGELAAIAANAWRYQCEGRNFADGGGVALPAAMMTALMQFAGADGLALYAFLRCHNSGRFMVANGMREIMPGGAWSLRRLQLARSALLSMSALIRVRAAITGIAAEFEFGRWDGARFCSPILTHPLPPASPALPDWQEAA